MLFARVKLRHLGDPAAQRPAQAEGLLDVNGRAVRAHAAEADHDRGDQRARRPAGATVARPTALVPGRGCAAGDGEWRRDNRPSPPVAWFERPPDERQLVKRKTIADEPMTVDEAVFDMDLLDYDFYLFTELASGQDAVVSRSPNDGLELQVLHPERMEPPVTTAPVALRSAPTPTLTVEDAREWLEAGDGPMVFFADSASGRGSVLYRRYDGHYGIVTPAG